MIVYSREWQNVSWIRCQFLFRELNSLRTKNHQSLDMTEPISWMVCPSHLLFPDRIIYETQKASRTRVSWRINTSPIETRVLDDRLLIPADRMLRFGATVYPHTFECSFYAIKHTVSGEFKVFGGSSDSGGHGYRSNWRGWNEQ